MNKKKIMISIIVFIVVIILAITYSYGFGIGDIDGNNVPGSTSKNIENSFGKVLSIVTLVGSITSIIVLVIIGIKYMVGSVEEKAAYKKTLMPYFIGAVFVFGASSITGIIYNLAINL